MNPFDFIALAIRLSNSQNEADLRSAVSRAYYGAFHVARQLLRDCGFRFPRKETHAAEIHRKVRYCLSESGNADALFASRGLKSLRNERNEADYDLDSTRFTTARSVAAIVRMAPEIADAIQQCREEPAFPAARDKMRIYARDVLRISIE